MRGPGIVVLLERALGAVAENAGTTITFTASRATEWHSATFSGMRHEIAAEAPTGIALDRWLAALAEAELPIAGHIVADLAVVSLSRDAACTRFELEALTVVAT